MESLESGQSQQTQLLKKIEEKLEELSQAAANRSTRDEILCLRQDLLKVLDAVANFDSPRWPQYHSPCTKT